MATVKGVNKTKADDPATNGLVNPGDLHGRVHASYDEYEAASLSANDLVELFQDLPVNARVITLEVFNDALGSGVTLDVGDSTTVDRYIDGADGNAVTKKEINEVDGFGYQITSTTTQILLKILGAAATGTIRSCVQYLTD